MTFVKPIFAGILLAVLYVGPTLTLCVKADEMSDKAKAALALSQSQRERSKVKTEAKKATAGVYEGNFYDDLDMAKATANMLHKPLTIWVGVDNSDAPIIYKSIEDDAVFVKVKSFNGDPSKRIIVPQKDGTLYKILPEEFDVATPYTVRNRMGLPITEEQRNTYLEVRHKLSLRQVNQPQIPKFIPVQNYQQFTPSTVNC